MLESYIICSPSIKLCSSKNVIVSVVVLIPPPLVVGNVLKNSFLNLVPITGSNTHPEPFPPVIPIETTLSTSKDWGSTKISSTLPVITGWTKAVVPIPVVMTIFGKLITSKSSPPFKTSTDDNGPKYILSFDL